MGAGDQRFAEAESTIGVAETFRPIDWNAAHYWLLYAITQALLCIAERLEPVAMRRAVQEIRQSSPTSEMHFEWTCPACDAVNPLTTVAGSTRTCPACHAVFTVYLIREAAP